jgi:hypothetical protein
LTDNEGVLTVHETHHGDKRKDFIGKRKAESCYCVDSDTPFNISTYIYLFTTFFIDSLYDVVCCPSLNIPASFRAAIPGYTCEIGTVSRTIQTQNIAVRRIMMDGDAPYGACDDDDATIRQPHGAQNMPRSDSA